MRFELSGIGRRFIDEGSMCFKNEIPESDAREMSA